MATDDTQQPVHPLVQRLSRALRVREGEGRKVLQFGLLAALVQMGVAIGLSAAHSLFLSRVGAEHLPTIYMLVPVVMLVYVPVMTYLQSRAGNERVFVGTLIALGTSAVALAGAYGAFTTGEARGGVIFYVGVLFAELWAVALYTLLWNFVDDYFDILDAKRLYAFFSGGMACGAIVGGTSVALLARVVGVHWLFVAWAGVAFATLPVVARLRRSWVAHTGEDPLTVAENSGSWLRSFGTLVDGLRGSRYVVVLVMVFLLTLVLNTIGEFQYMAVFEEGRTEEQVAVLFGVLYALVNVFNLLANAFLFGRLVVVLGVRGVALIQPMVFAVAFSLLVLNHGMGAALVAFFALQGIMTSIEFNNQNFLFNALPTRLKAELRTIIEGLGEPLATGFTGLMLMLVAQRVAPEMLSLVGLGLAVIGFGLVLWLRFEYVAAMVSNLRESWLDFSRTSGIGESVPDEEERVVLTDEARSPDPERAVSAIRMIWVHDRIGALDLLLGFVDRSTTHEQRFAAPLLAVMLAEDDSEILRRVLHWLQQRREPLAAAIAEELGHHDLLSADEVEGLLRAASPDSRAAASVVLWKSWRLDANFRGMNITRELLQGTPEERMAAIRAMGKLDQPRYAQFLARFLSDPSAGIRKQALATMFDLVGEGADAVLPQLLDVVAKGDRAERLIGLEALAKIRSAESIAPLARITDRFAPFERRQAEAVVEGIGLRSVPNLISILRSNGCPYAGKSMAARVLGRVSLPQLEAITEDIIGDELGTAYAYMASRRVLSREQSGDVALSVLARLCSDMQQDIVEFVLEVLTIGGRLPNFELMASSLRSDSPRDRANAVEAMEQGCPREVFRRLLPLLESSSSEEALAAYSRHYHMGEPDVTDVLRRLITGPSAFGAAAAVQAAMVGLRESVGNREEFSCLIRDRLLASPGDSPVPQVVFAVLLRRRFPDDPRCSELDIVERAETLADTAFFAGFGVSAIAHLARWARQRFVPEGALLVKAGGAAREFYVPIDMKMHAVEDDGSTVGWGVVGLEALRGWTAYRREVVSTGGEVLVVPARAVAETVELYPSFGIRLLERVRTHTAASDRGEAA